MILIALGASLPSVAGEPADTLRAALAALGDNGVEVREVSRFFRTPAWPDPRDPAFVNAVARVETGLPPVALLEVLHSLERQFGRERATRNAPRTLDLDLIDYDGMVLAGPPELPHPRMHERAFVLVPLGDVAPDWRHPVSGASHRSLVASLPEADIKAVLPIGEYR